MRYIAEYTSTWPRSFEEIRQAIRPALPESCKTHHVGSTAIPGMPAKDIIDVDVECPAGAIEAVIRGLAGVGYEHEGDKGIPGREAFRPRPGSVVEKLPPHHLYACEESALELRRHLAFRDYLLARRERMIWLAEQKRLADRMARCRDEYIRNKAQAYAAITAEALAWTAANPAAAPPE